MKDAQEDLQDTQYDRYISEQKKLLSDLSDNYKETLNARLDNIDALVADMITKSNENKESINQTLQTEFLVRIFIMHQDLPCYDSTYKTVFFSVV